MEGCGAAPKWPPGWQSVWGVRSIPVVAGITYDGLAEAPACLARNTPKAMKPYNRLLKKLPEELEKLHQEYPHARVEL